MRPACGRCKQRGLICSGFPADVGYTFRDENETAQKNSERARREHRDCSALVIAFDRTLSQKTQEERARASTEILDPFLAQHHPWINEGTLIEVQEPLQRDLETLAVDQFFMNWTLYPSNDGLSPGYLHELYRLYLSAPPESVLWLAVRATAFADMRSSPVGDMPFHIKARQTYGLALSRMREITRDEQKVADDRVLAAILLIDNFEVPWRDHILMICSST